MSIRARTRFTFAVMVNPRTGTVFLDRLLEYRLRPTLVVTHDPFYAGEINRVRQQLKQARTYLRYLRNRKGFHARYDTYCSAKRHKLCTFPAQAVNSRLCAELLHALDLDYIFVFSFPLVEDYIFNAPRYGTINFHPSLLPRHRGPDPIFWTVRDNDRLTGITFHYIDEGVDTGRIIAQYQVMVDGLADSSVLTDYLSSVGARKFVEIIYRLKLGYPVERGVESSLQPSHEARVKKIDRTITPDMTADDVICVVQAAREYGLASISVGGREFKIVDAFVLPAIPDGMDKEIQLDELNNVYLRPVDGRILYLVTGE